LQQRESGDTEKVLSVQLEGDLKNIKDVTKVVIAYEPVWAIGTGVTATDEQAQDTIAYIRKKIGELFTQAEADKVIIQYGGSMNAKNCKGLMAQPDIDGGLIGGASLKLDFATIVNYNK
jgi:triosephosphate isomerase